MDNPLVFRTRQQFPIAVVEFEGELDFDTAPTVYQALRKHLADQPAALVVDLTALVVRRTAALSALRAAFTSASEWPGLPLIVVAPDEAMQSMLRRAGLNRQAPIVADHTCAFALAASHPVPLKQVLRDLPPDPHVLKLVRNVVAEACLRWGIAATTASTQLVACELMSNAIEHARSPADFTIALRDRRVHVTVRDGSSLMPRRTGPRGPGDPHGRGLVLIDDLAASWGTVRTETGKLVWAMVPVERAHVPAELYAQSSP
jgi:anti-anti-sigma factor